MNTWAVSSVCPAGGSWAHFMTVTWLFSLIITLAPLQMRQHQGSFHIHCAYQCGYLAPAASCRRGRPPVAQTSPSHCSALPGEVPASSCLTGLCRGPWLSQPAGSSPKTAAVQEEGAGSSANKYAASTNVVLVALTYAICPLV